MSAPENRERPTVDGLIGIAVEAMKTAYAPYSGFLVGAALETEDGKIYTGRNIENASYGATVCAERTAFFRAVGEGERNFRRIAVVGGKGGEITSFSWPCGICRQVMREFCGDGFEILSFDGNSVASAKMKDLLPSPFSKDILEP